MVEKQALTQIRLSIGPLLKGDKYNDKLARACKLEIYLLYLQSDPYFMQVTLRKLNPSFAGYNAGTASVLTSNAGTHISRLSTAGVLHSNRFGFHYLITGLFRSSVISIMIFPKKFRQLNFDGMNALLNDCPENNYFKYLTL